MAGLVPAIRVFVQAEDMNSGLHRLTYRAVRFVNVNGGWYKTMLVSQSKMGWPSMAPRLLQCMAASVEKKNATKGGGKSSTGIDRVTGRQDERVRHAQCRAGRGTAGTTCGRGKPGSIGVLCSSR